MARLVLVLLSLPLIRGVAGAQENIPPPTAVPPAAGAAPAVPNGVEVMARGPVHEAFATPSAEAQPTSPVPRKPPAPLEEMPPEERPEGDVVWIAGYWAWDDDRSDYLWVSGCWRVKPAGKDWVPGYWREVGTDWQWVPGFWTAGQQANAGQANAPQQVTYFPQPPAPPAIAPPGPAPYPDHMYVPGVWTWNAGRYAWRAGYWTPMRPGYVYVPSHYRWTPQGYVFIPGYWDLAVSRRGLLYAPVVVDPVVAGPQFVYTPAYAVTDTIMLDALFVRPASCHYYFGDYYGPRYVTLGFEPCVVYSRRHYEPIIAYQRWEYRNNPRWFDVQVTLFNERSAGRAPLPPRTLVQQNTIIRNNVTNVTINNSTTINNTTINNTKVTQALAPASSVVAARGQRVVAVDTATRARVQQQAQTLRQTVAADRKQVEQGRVAAGAPHTATLAVPASPATHVGSPTAHPTTTPAVGTTQHPSTNPLKGRGTPPHPVGTAPAGTNASTGHGAVGIIPGPTTQTHPGPMSHPTNTRPPAKTDDHKKGPNH